MRYPVLSLFFLLSLLVSSGCAGAKNLVQLSEEDKDRNVFLQVGDSLEIVLQGNPTTGYMWNLAPWDRRVLEQVGEYAYKATSDAMGSGGRYTFSFKAIGSGKADLKWSYARPFEKNMPPVKSFEVHCSVSE